MKYILIEKAPELINVIRNSIIVLPSSDGGSKIVVKGNERLHMVSTYPALHSIVAIYKGDDAYLFNTRELLPSWMKETVEEYIAPEFNALGVCTYCGLHAEVNDRDMCQSCTVLEAEELEAEEELPFKSEDTARTYYYYQRKAARFDARVEKKVEELKGKSYEWLEHIHDNSLDAATSVAAGIILTEYPR